MKNIKQLVNPLFYSNNRLYSHILFWLIYYLYRVQLYIDIYPNTQYVQLLEMLCILPVVYLNFYVLLPHFLKKKKTFEYAILILISIFITSILLTETIRFMMKIGIYTQNYYLLYSGWKMTTLLWRIINIVLATSAIKILKEAYLNQQINQKLEKEKLENELKYLKTQINPHFFFNTLNNLYALVQQKSDHAPDVILKLSSLMQYMLYETNQNLVPLSKEFETLTNYIELEKLRFGDGLNISMETSGEFDKQLIAPMLLIPIMENSFKHGISSSEASNWINIKLELQLNQFRFRVENKCGDEEASEIGGIGLPNIRRRMELIYKGHYELKTEQNSDSFTTLLIIDLDKATYLQQP